ncbi:MAG: HAD-IA family hydrolase [Bacteroidetes bacterium]|nr:HAD-IA family hydrolase [Bacteroidota bacterium]MCH8522920.1 HAD-IA family hydrolase [Balneolales bacterium]
MSPRSTIEFIFFDIDDTILDHKAAERAALRDTQSQLKCFTEVGISELQDVYHRINAGLWKEYGAGRIDRAFLEESRFSWTLRDLGIDQIHSPTFRQTYMQLYEHHWQWVPGAREALSEIHKHFPIGFLTNGFTEIQQKKGERFDLYALTDAYIISEEVGFMKPMPGIFEFATRQVGFAPEQILYVGDSFISDIQGGASFGWETAWFTRENDAAKLKKASFYFNDYKSLLNYLNIQGY